MKLGEGEMVVVEHYPKTEGANGQDKQTSASHKQQGINQTVEVNSHSRKISITNT